MPLLTNLRLIVYTGGADRLLSEKYNLTTFKEVCMFPLILSLLCANACNAQSLDVQLSLKSKLAQNTYSGTFDITQSKQLHISTEKVDSSDGYPVTIDMLKNNIHLLPKCRSTRNRRRKKRTTCRTNSRARLGCRRRHYYR